MYPLSLSIHVARLPNETDKQYNHRCWFIAHLKPRTITQYQQAVKWSIIDANIQFLKCQYVNDIHDKVSRLRNNLLSA